MKNVKLGRAAMPALGFGTWPLKGEMCYIALNRALDIGYRHIDTAAKYENEAAVGDAIADSSVERSDLFITTKVWVPDLGYEDVLDTVAQSLSLLGVEHIDLVLIHKPNEQIPLSETIDAMNELVANKKALHFGVSNFDVDQLERALEHSEEPVAVNQIEYNLLNPRNEMLDFCDANNVAVTAYRPLGQGALGADDALDTIEREAGERVRTRVERLTDKYDKKTSQIALRWLVQQPNVSAIPRAAAEEYQRQNISIFDFQLTDEEMGALSSQGDNRK